MRAGWEFLLQITCHFLPSNVVVVIILAIGLGPDDISLCLWQYLNKAKWNWRLMRTIMTTCHIYDEDENYVSFEKVSPEESQPISFLRKVMPDYA